MTRYIYLIRHGQTTLSDKKLYIGQSDCDLSQCGIKSAHRAAKILKNHSIDLLFSSDLKRTKKTAQIISRSLGINTPVYNKNLREINLGSWEGRSVEYVKSAFPDLYKKRGDNLLSFNHPGGETFSQLFKRANAEFEAILNSAQKENIAVVTHAGVIRAIICKILSIPVKNQFLIKLAYGGITVISANNGQLKIETLNFNPAFFIK